ncbi:MAG: FAD-dependent oxidoreductase, partial [Pseudomonadota bacterium]
MAGIVIVGGGQAGSSLAAKARSLDPGIPITLISAESDPPYQRPPLSKAYLLGDMERERLYLRPEAYYADNDITLKLGAPVERIDIEKQSVHVVGTDIFYDHLALTTGSVANRLPADIGGDLDGVFTVRTLADVDRMEPSFQSGARVLVVGGGYIGLEAAAVASKLGVKVTLVEMADRILGRVASAETANIIRAVHEGHGVDIREGVSLDRLTGDGRVTGAVLSDGTHLDIDFVVVGTGIHPDTRLAESAGIDCDDGIAVDAMGRTSADHVWSAGDCASFPYGDARIRLESVQNA